jgi:arylsulfatase A-like enzyme
LIPARRVASRARSRARCLLGGGLSVFLPAFFLLSLLAGCGGKASRRPDILLIVVDTLRYDHLGAYGYGRPTSPEIDSRLAARGVLVRSAYAQAPWTLPSMASLHSGRRAEELLDDKGQPSGIPEPVATLAERLQAGGYRTAAFIANPTMHRGNGFAQGFDDFETAPYELASMSRHADDINGKALPWLQRRGEERDRPPYFLYLHYLDPHDPYDNADIVDGKSPFFPEYAGKLRGGDVHGLYLGAVELAAGPAEREQDLKQLAALYDSEVRYVDRRIGEVLAALPAERLASTLIALTADHGEELFDHGGFKHGETLYEELIHVPLIFRWDGRLPAGAKLGGTVRLLDLMPTFLAAAGSTAAGIGGPVLPAEPEGARPREGIDLLPALAGGALPELPAFVRHFAGGPLRLARIAGGRKEILFDRHGPVAPADEQERKLWQRDVGRLARHELYDLAADPREKRDLAAAGETGSPGELWADLDPWLDGLRLAVAGLEGCERVEGELEIAGGELRVRPLFLAAADVFAHEGKRLSFAFRGEKLPKGLLVAGELERVEKAAARCDGKPLAIAVGGQGAAATAPLELRALLAAPQERPLEAGGGLSLWLRRPAVVLGGGERDEETAKRLKALGYTG